VRAYLGGRTTKRNGRRKKGMDALRETEFGKFLFKVETVDRWRCRLAVKGNRVCFKYIVCQCSDDSISLSLSLSDRDIEKHSRENRVCLDE
jgi:hypothetical protein